MTIKGLFSRKGRARVRAAAVTLVAESHFGHHGYSVFEGGKRVAWGANQTAAVAAYEVARAA